MPLPNPISRADLARSLYGREDDEPAHYQESLYDDTEIPVLPPRDSEVLTDADRELLRGVIDEMAVRLSEALRLFRPMPEQERFFASGAGERIALGGNRGGKTTVTVVELARAVTGQDPYDKYPKEDGRCILVGRDLKHCSKVFYEKLFKPGAFRVIRDIHTGEWRSYDPSCLDDLDRPLEAKKSPPLIPKRFYDEKLIAWENKKDEIPNTITLYNGWKIYLFASGGTIPQGWDVDVVAFDEEIEVPGWYTEMAARLVDRRQEDRVTGHVKSGKFIWSATPQAGTQRLFDLCNRADRDREADSELLQRGEAPPRPVIEKFLFGLLDNSYMHPEAVAELIAKYAENPEEYEVRIKGNFALLGSRVYGEFMPKGVHGCAPIEIGSDWTRYCAIDPGFQVCAILFCAIPPPESQYAGRKFLYDELYIKKCSAPLFAKMLKEKIGCQSIHKFIIDHRAGRQHDFSSGKTNEENYSEALREAGVASETTGHGFAWGSDDMKAGITAVKAGLHVHDGFAEWVVVRDRCPWFVWEVERYSFRRNPDKTPTDEPVKLNDHLMDCLRYLAMENLKWVRPRTQKRNLGYTTEAMKRKKDRARNKAVAMGESGIKVY